MRKTISAAAFIYLLCIASPLVADDTAIFTGEATSVKPNVLIIFDNSGSMESDIAGTAYNKDYDYEGAGYTTYEEDTLYSYNNRLRRYVKYPSGTTTGTSVPYTSITCAEALTSLTTYGWYKGNLTSTYACSTSNRNYVEIWRGKYLNYLAWINAGNGGGWTTKLQAAYDVLEEVLNSTSEDAVNFGLMIFDSTDYTGGVLLAPVGSTHDTIMQAADDYIMCSSGCWHGNTPLAETLATAGLYYAGKYNWATAYRTGTSYGGYTYHRSQFAYGSPVEYPCQKNYILLLTDGMPTSDAGSNDASENIFTTTSSYYFGKAIGDYDSDGAESTSSYSHYLDDVAKFLYEGEIFTGNTANGETITGTDGANKIVTYAIGVGDEFASGNAGANLTFLERVTDSTHGRGATYTADSVTSLSTAFQSVLNNIIVSNSSFIAPVVPVSKLNKVYSGNSVYLSLFLPDQVNAFWYGNLKKFGLGSSGNILDREGNVATDNYGQINDTASSCWSESSSDGSDPSAGGAGAILLGDTSRNFYTHNDDDATCSANLYDSTNVFGTTNTAAMTKLGATDSSDLTAWLTATGKYATNGTDPREWVLGDILHSKPTTMYYNTGTEYHTIIFLGSNDGFLHALVDDDNGTADDLSDDDLTEAWSFIPWDILPSIKSIQAAGTHSAFVDGSPTIYDDKTGGKRYLAFGLRRGGSSYYSLDIGTLNTTTGAYTGGYAAPKYNWKISSTFLSTETLGQSWSKPLFATIRTSTTATNDVLLMTGGYDATNQDATTPGSDTVGRAVYAVDATTGALQTNLSFNYANTTGDNKMNSCIVELTAFDKDSDGCDDTVYAGDLGGDVFGFNDRDENGSWTNVKLFSARSSHADPSTASTLLKFFYEPDVAVMSDYDYVYIGTGDREHPSETDTINRIYAIKNTWTSSCHNLDEADLKDVTSYTVYSDDDFATELESSSGWFIKLSSNDGEKVVSSPLVYNKIVFFTTYSPDADTSGTDPCHAGNLGTGRLYALDYITGKAAIDFNTGNNTTEVVLDNSDRSISLGTGIPSSPTLVVTKDGGAMLIIGTSGAGGTTGARTFSIPSTSKATMYYWKQK